MMILSDAIQIYMKYCYSLSPKTRKIYQEHLNKFLAKKGDLPIGQISHQQLIDYVSGLRQKDGKAVLSWLSASNLAHATHVLRILYSGRLD